ncbi:putative amino acid dehydrogenase [Desulfohalotomaculum tongense]|uniref:shikimate dehydrogenase n=1 Tax=Desulforadius tongensis TaxID=1216062 RepID=UPI00195D119F|nr:shikimate dehydrogenase [Desulforadius tongensis]MBM7856045.1 putative amino acid dehydrogenase [Desulforadius tongensis]
MKRFAFIIHPLDVSDVARKFSIAKYMPAAVVEKALRLMPSFTTSHITGVKSLQNKEAEGWFITCPLTAKQMLSLPREMVIKKIIQAGKVAEKLGAGIVGLGAFTSVVGDAGVTVAKNLNIAVTTGNSYTVATAIEATQKAVKMLGRKLSDCHLVVVGATGSIGQVCSIIMARHVKHLTLVGRNTGNLKALAAKILYETGLACTVSSDVKRAVPLADIVITVTSSVDTVIEPEDLKTGAVVCDVARPRDVSRRVAKERKDVLVIEGGVVEVPGSVNFNLDFGFPRGTAYACMAETMILALEGLHQNYSLGRNLTVQQVERISALAEKHGFKLAGFRSFERVLPAGEIQRVKKQAEKQAS